jgi:hypothetical protein
VPNISYRGIGYGMRLLSSETLLWIQHEEHVTKQSKVMRRSRSASSGDMKRYKN